MNMGSESVHANRMNPVLRSLTSRRRRLVLATLADESAPVPVEELATHVAAAVHDTSAATVAGDVRKREYVSLVHCQLPKLDEADLVEWNREDDVVTMTDHPALSDSRLRHVIDSPDREWDDVLKSLANDRRCVVLSVLVEHGGAIARHNLARRTAAIEQGVRPGAVSHDAIDDVMASLCHVHLPRLRDAGLIVDDDLETVRYDGHPDLDEESLTIGSDERAPAMVPVAD